VDLTQYTVLFVVLLVAYEGYAFWARLDPRFPLLGALGLILLGAAASELMAPGTAEVLGIFGFLMLLAGMAGLLFAPFRRPTADAAPAARADPVDHRDPAADPRLDDLQQHPVPVVDGPGGPDHQAVQRPDGEP
jgi:hypothetical protein